MDSVDPTQILLTENQEPQEVINIKTTSTLGFLILNQKPSAFSLKYEHPESYAREGLRQYIILLYPLINVCKYVWWGMYIMPVCVALFCLSLFTIFVSWPHYLSSSVFSPLWRIRYSRRVIGPMPLWYYTTLLHVYVPYVSLCCDSQLSRIISILDHHGISHSRCLHFEI